VAEDDAALAYREDFQVAEAALVVICERCPDFADEDAAWSAFVDWCGPDDAAYLKGIRSGRKFIFYGVVQDLYDFAREVCGADVAELCGRRLATALLTRHMPDLVRTSLFETGSLCEQIQWLMLRFVAGATGEVYEMAFDPAEDGQVLGIKVTYRHDEAIADYLKRSGHNPERAFANSYHVMHGALLSLLSWVVYDFSPRQLDAQQHAGEAHFTLHLKPENRFYYENFIEVLLDYAQRLRDRKEREQEARRSETEGVRNPAMRETLARIRTAAACDEVVLLRGESGTGKSYYARVIHETGGRRTGPLVEVSLTSDVGSDNMIQSNLFGHVRGAFTGADDEKQGLFPLADGGTIFLDEIGDASPELQAKLLRVVEAKRFKMLGGTTDIAVDVRVIAATNRDLAAMVADGRFRQDLYYRLDVIDIALPPLRERPEDLPALINTLFDNVRHVGGKPELELSPGAVAALCAHDWPGNIRELENALRHAVAFAAGSVVTPDDLPEVVSAKAPEVFAPSLAILDTEALQNVLARPDPPEGTATHEWQGHIDYVRRRFLLTLIRHYRGNVREIARHWDRSSENTIVKYIRQFGLQQDLEAARQS
jgi:DNA-binding NtrC family response regulator